MKTRLHTYHVSFDNEEEYHLLKREIFSQDVYYFESTQVSPRIIDAGAHIGLSILYFKKLFPTASITAIEPLPQNITLLEKNIWENNLAEVDIIPAALWLGTGEVPFYIDSSNQNWFSTAGMQPKAWNGQQKTRPITVPTTTLSSLLTQHIDFLKLDIEGAESAVLAEAAEKLHWIDQILLEFHPGAHHSLVSLCEFLGQQGYCVEILKNHQRVELHNAGGLVYVHAARSIE